MCFLFKLNKYLLIPIVTDWLSTEDFINLDSSLSNLEFKLSWVNFTAQHPIIFQNCLFSHDQVLPLSIGLLEWVTQRKLSVQQLTNLQLTNSMMNTFKLKEKKRSSFTSKLKFWKKRCVVIRDEGYERRLLLFNFLQSITNLKVNLCSESNLSFFLEVIKRCTNLEEISIKHQYHLAVETIADYCPKLKVCNVERCVQLSEQLIISICKKCPNLSSLNVRECRNVGRAFTLSLIINCTKLKYLNVLGCYRLVDQDILLISMHCRFLLQQIHYREFSYLSLRTFLWFKGVQLNCLEISHNYYITETTVSEIGIVCPDVTSISLVNCANVCDPETVDLINTLPSLRDLTLQWLPKLTDESFRYFIQKCGNLKELTLSNNTLITATWLPSIGTYCKNLISLCLKSMNLTDDILIAIVQPLLYLVELDVSFNYELTNKALMVLAPSCYKLQKLNMSWWHRVTDQTFIALGKYCRSLIDLNVDGCKLITDVGLNYILKNCTKLQRLDITRCVLISPEAINHTLCSVKLKLSYLNINSCPLLNSVETLKNIIRCCTRLTQFKVSHITIKDAGLLKNLAVEVNPDLELVLLYVTS